MEFAICYLLTTNRRFANYYEDTPMLFNKLPGFARAAPGFERKILARLPRAALIGILAAILPSLAIRFLPWAMSSSELVRLTTAADIWAISLLMMLWTVGATVGIAAFIVMVMKGPAYVADPYALSDAETPDR